MIGIDSQKIHRSILLALVHGKPFMTIEELRKYAIHNSLFPPTTLGRAIRRLSFVQADPIRSPARAQDLILRHRVIDYSAGDLEKKYPKLDVEEDILYAYGFVSRPVWNLLYPRRTKKRFNNEDLVLEAVRTKGVTHPRKLSEDFGAGSVRNNWGGSSKATTRAMENLHRRGLLRVAKRESGIRLYEPASATTCTLSLSERYRELILIVVKILAPAPEKSIRSALAPLRRMLFGKMSKQDGLGELVSSGELHRESVEGISYVWPFKKMVKREVPQIVRILAPFDPLVWDRKRFERFWGWSYKFEAYKPRVKRIRGYYAMPMLWGDHVIGWVNIGARENELESDIGFVGKAPKGKEFRKELEAELEQMRWFYLGGEEK